jgi:hypothetical protein
MLKELWNRFTSKRDAEAAERADERQHMSPGERRFFDQSFEDRQAVDEAEAHLSGGDQASPELED